MAPLLLPAVAQAVPSLGYTFMKYKAQRRWTNAIFRNEILKQLPCRQCNEGRDAEVFAEASVFRHFGHKGVAGPVLEILGDDVDVPLARRALTGLLQGWQLPIRTGKKGRRFVVGDKMGTEGSSGTATSVGAEVAPGGVHC